MSSRETDGNFPSGSTAAAAGASSVPDVGQSKASVPGGPGSGVQESGVQSGAAQMPPLVNLPERLSYRSMPALIMGSVLSLLLVGVSGAMWLGMGPLARSQWTLPQLVTIIFFLIIVLVIVMSVGLSKVVATPSGVTVRNAVRTHHYQWRDVEDFVMSPGDPWVYLKLADTPEEEGDTRLVLGVQRSEGEVAEEKLEMLRAYARKHRDA